MGSFYSAGFHAAVRPHLGWASEQADHFDRLVPVGHVHTDFDRRTARQGGYELRIGLLGSYAEDGTWLWSWANTHFTGRPVTEEAERLRRIGAERGIPELTEGLVDLTHLPDPRLGSDHLAMGAMALLGARGLIIFNHSGRARTFLAVTDPAVPWARPSAEGTVRALRTAAVLLADPGHDAGRGCAETVVAGYLDHHGLTAATAADGTLTAALDGGNVLTARFGADGGLDSVAVSGPDGGPARQDAAPSTAEGLVRVTTTTPAPRPFPAGLLPHVLPRLARTLAQDATANDHLDRAAREPGAPAWDAGAGVLRFPGAGDRTAREIGGFDPATGTLRWAADAPGAARLRGLATESGHPDLAAETADLSGYRAPGNTADILVRTAADLGGARGIAVLDDEDGGSRYVAITDTRVPEAEGSLDTVGDAVLGAADRLHPVTPSADLRPVMRALARGYFDAFGVPVVEVYGPEAIGGMFGLYEARVYFSVDGTVQRVTRGLFGVPH
jgi:hypothetical protein